jgi:hypothetical protein
LKAPVTNMSFVCQVVNNVALMILKTSAIITSVLHRTHSSPLLGTCLKRVIDGQGRQINKLMYWT